MINPEAFHQITITRKDEDRFKLILQNNQQIVLSEQMSKYELLAVLRITLNNMMITP